MRSRSAEETFSAKKVCCESHEGLTAKESLSLCVAGQTFSALIKKVCEIKDWNLYRD